MRSSAPGRALPARPQLTESDERLSFLYLQAMEVNVCHLRAAAARLIIVPGRLSKSMVPDTIPRSSRSPVAAPKHRLGSGRRPTHASAALWKIRDVGDLPARQKFPALTSSSCGSVLHQSKLVKKFTMACCNIMVSSPRPFIQPPPVSSQCSFRGEQFLQMSHNHPPHGSQAACEARRQTQHRTAHNG